jgi:glycosyltransferase involved in cell wall biosynthesis
MTLDEIYQRTFFRLRGRVIHLSPKSTPRGAVLLSYITLPYLKRDERTLNAHSNRWESMDMAQAFVERGFEVDLIDITNTTFTPKKKYTFFIDNYHHMERLTPLLNADCKKIFHATTSHWLFNNAAEEKRFENLALRRGVRVRPDRPLPHNKAIELCDEATLLGNDFTESTYAFAAKKMTRIPVSTTHTFSSPQDKNVDKARNNFIWFGGAGVIHKGLDLVVEACAETPELSLTICGKIDGETDFLKIYERELALPNIKVAGFMDPGSDEFKKICSESIALIYPSCAEGQAGSVVLTMHAGLIPIVSRESGVDVEGFGTILKENTIEEIKKELEIISNLPTETLKSRSLSAWEYAREHHTREVFAKTHRDFIDRLVAKYHV